MTLTKLMKGLAPVGLLAALPSTAFAAANLHQMISSGFHSG
jgi:hypothetical protein